MKITAPEDLKGPVFNSSWLIAHNDTLRGMNNNNNQPEGPFPVPNRGFRRRRIY